MIRVLPNSSPLRSRRRMLAACTLTALLLLATLASGPTAPRADADDTPSEPVRWATLLPFVATAMRSVEGHHGPVAEVRATMHAPPPAGVADLGSAHQPNFEVLFAARPQLIVGDRVLHAALASRLEASGAEILLLDTSSVQGTLDGLAEVARRLDAAEAIASELARVEGALEAIEFAGAPEVLPLYGVPGRYLLVTDQTWIGDLIVRSGGSLTAPIGLAAPALAQAPAQAPAPDRRSASATGYLQVNDEWMAAQRPDVVLLLTHGDPEAIEATFRQRIAEGGAWQPLAASVGDRIHALPPGLFSTNPGLGLADAALAIQRLMPEPTAPVAAGPGA